MHVMYQMKSAEMTQKFAELLATRLEPSTVITLEGELGAGKTTFTQGLAKGLGITRVVNSPTFTILKVYRSGRLPLYHIDAYRLADSEEDLGLEEFFYGVGVSVVEWPCYVAAWLPQHPLQLTLSIVDETTRTLEIVCSTPQQIDLLRKVVSQWNESFISTPLSAI